MMSASDKRIYLYDSTLRDGAQTRGVDFSVTDKRVLAETFDRFGLDYIEGGWPGANPTDDAFFAAPPKLKSATLVAFGMTRRSGRSAGNDSGLRGVIASGAKAVCVVGKAWTFQVDAVLQVSREENLRMISDTVAEAAAVWLEVLFDAEHFFDGFKEDRGYALACAQAARDAGARWIVLCDTNGGNLPHEIEEIVGRAAQKVPGRHLGIHCHDDTGNAVANSLAAVRAGACQVQGTFNGLGERCGNANIVTLIPTLAFKLGYELGITREQMVRLTHVSRLVDEVLNRVPDRSAPYVGESAFAHKGGLHASAIAKDTRAYEHIDPAWVGNRRHVVVSDQAGRANLMAELQDLGLGDEYDPERLGRLLEEVKRREFEGYTYDGAEASFELLARRALGMVPDYFELESFRVLDERRWNAKGGLVMLSEATVKVAVGKERTMTVAEGSGPVNALDLALRKALEPAYPALRGMRLTDYKVRILSPQEGTGARIRVIIECADEHGTVWSTVGVSRNVIDASYDALRDGITYRLLRASAAQA